MHETARSLIDSLGGYREVAARLGMKPTSLHTHISSGSIPARWFVAFCDLAVLMGKPKPPSSLFTFESLPMVCEDGAAAPADTSDHVARTGNEVSDAA